MWKNYIERIKKVYELKGQRFEPEDLKKYKKDGEIYLWNVPNKLPKLRIVYNNEVINILRKREIKELVDKAKGISTSCYKKIKSKINIRKKFKKRDLKRMSIGVELSIINVQ